MGKSLEKFGKKVGRELRKMVWKKVGGGNLRKKVLKSWEKRLRKKIMKKIEEKNWGNRMGLRY